MTDFNVCGVLVMVAPDLANTVAETLQAMDGVEVHANENSRLVVTVEGPNDREFANVITDFASIKGVLSTSLCYHEIETETVPEVSFHNNAAPSQESL